MDDSQNTQKTQPKQPMEVHGVNFVTRLQQLDGDFYHLKRWHLWQQDTLVTEVFAMGWKLFIIDPKACPVNLMTDQLLRPAGNELFALFLPAKEVVCWQISASYIYWEAYTSNTPLRVNLPGAVMFPWDRTSAFSTAAEVAEHLIQLKYYTPVSRRAETCSVAQRTKDYLDAHYTNDLSMRTIANTLNVPYSTMTHYFRRSFGLSPSEYRQHLRITAAGGLIVSHEKSATESCFATGHGDYSAFKQGFKKVFGVSPRHFSKVADSTDTCHPPWRKEMETW
ncbi:MAG: helix-turn-helix transcriptional regulator [Bdellovibrionales bacterium]|nr:helix-turn-helix transcriptional regulator [Bdellovibrionales bacterium]